MTSISCRVPLIFATVELGLTERCVEYGRNRLQPVTIDVAACRAGKLFSIFETHETSMTDHLARSRQHQTGQSTTAFQDQRGSVPQAGVNDDLQKIWACAPVPCIGDSLIQIQLFQQGLVSFQTILKHAARRVK